MSLGIKKILFLGGAPSQLPAIKYAKEAGFYVITCDYKPSNPGHLIADKYYNISSTNYELIYEVARREKIDAISSYASDPGAYTAAKICQQLGLVGSSPQAVETLSSKEKFRTFLKQNNLNHPEFIIGADINDFINVNSFPGVLKPTDASGSKGVVKISSHKELIEKFEVTKSFSREGKVIYEQFIDRKGPQVHGEAFVINNEIVFCQLGDQYFSPVNSVVPYCTIVPSIYHTDSINRIRVELESIIKKLDFGTGGMNIEAMIDEKDNVYFVEIGPRSGGNFMPDLMNISTNVDLIKMNIDALICEGYKAPNKEFCHASFQVIFHAFSNGVFNKIDIPDELIALEKKLILNIKKGDQVSKYLNSNDVIGVGIFEVGDLQRSAIESILINHEFAVLE